MMADLIESNITPLVDPNGSRFEFIVSVRTGHSKAVRVRVIVLSREGKKTFIGVTNCHTHGAVRRGSRLYAVAKECARNALMSAVECLASTSD